MTSDDKENRENLIYGVWYEGHSQPSHGRLVLRREPPAPDPCDWGQRYEFQENGNLIDAYTAPCGNDYSIHTWSGRWEFDRERDLLLMQIEKVDFAGIMELYPCNPPEDYKQGRKYFIAELTEERMVLSSSESRT